MAQSKIKWNGDTVGYGNISVVWGSNTYTWDEVIFIQEIADGVGTGSRRRREEQLRKLTKDEEKRKKLVHLICRVKGEKVYDEKKESIMDYEIKIDDVDLVVTEVLGKIKVETEDVV